MRTHANGPMSATVAGPASITPSYERRLAGGLPERAGRISLLSGAMGPGRAGRRPAPRSAPSRSGRRSEPCGSRSRRGSHAGRSSGARGIARPRALPRGSGSRTPRAPWVDADHVDLPAAQIEGGSLVGGQRHTGIHAQVVGVDPLRERIAARREVVIPEDDHAGGQLCEQLLKRGRAGTARHKVARARRFVGSGAIVLGGVRIGAPPRSPAQARSSYVTGRPATSSPAFRHDVRATLTRGEPESG